MKKIKILLIFIFSLLIAQPPGSDSIACEARYKKIVDEILKTLENNLRAESNPKTDELLAKARRYIDLTLEKAKIKHNIEVIERTWLSSPEIQGILRTPYENYTHCLNEKLLTPQVSLAKSCENPYQYDVKVGLQKLTESLDYNKATPDQKEEIFKNAKLYIDFVRRQSYVDEQKLLLERNTDIINQKLQGNLLAPITDYLKCLDPKLVIPLIES